MFSNKDLSSAIHRIAGTTHFPLTVTQQNAKLELCYGDVRVSATMGAMHAFADDSKHGESPFPVIIVDHLTQQVVLFLHGDTPYDLTMATARLLSLVVSLPLMRAGRLQPCRWCALPIPDRSARGILQAQAECPTCHMTAAVERSYALAIVSTGPESERCGIKLDEL